MTYVAVIDTSTIVLGASLIAGSFIVEGIPHHPPGPIFLSGFYIACLGSLATVLSVLVNL